MNPSISCSVFEAETENLCRVKFEHKYVGGVYLGISQTTGHMSVFFSFLQKLSQLGRTVGVYYILYFNRLLINKQLLTGTFSYILKKTY